MLGQPAIAAAAAPQRPQGVAFEHWRQPGLEQMRGSITPAVELVLGGRRRLVVVAATQRVETPAAQRETLSGGGPTPTQLVAARSRANIRVVTTVGYHDNQPDVA
jgi:hypothetical protein